MIKGRGENKVTGKPVYILALEPKNIEMLVAGKPMAINLKEMGGPDAEILLMAGPDYERMKAQAIEMAAVHAAAEVVKSWH